MVMARREIPMSVRRAIAEADVLTEVLEQFPDRFHHELRDALFRRVRDVAEMNNRNGQLLNGALRIVDRSIEAYSRVGREGSYQPSGERARAARTTVLDQRV